MNVLPVATRPHGRRRTCEWNLRCLVVGLFAIATIVAAQASQAQHGHWTIEDYDIEIDEATITPANSSLGSGGFCYRTVVSGCPALFSLTNATGVGAYYTFAADKSTEWVPDVGNPYEDPSTLYGGLQLGSYSGTDIAATFESGADASSFMDANCSGSLEGTSRTLSVGGINAESDYPDGYDDPDQSPALYEDYDVLNPDPGGDAQSYTGHIFLQTDSSGVGAYSSCSGNVGFGSIYMASLPLPDNHSQMLGSLSKTGMLAPKRAQAAATARRHKKTHADALGDGRLRVK